jgi:hypothetical protein
MSIAVLAAGLALAVWVAALFNGLIRLRNTGNNAWSDVDVHLKKGTTSFPIWSRR